MGVLLGTSGGSSNASTTTSRKGSSVFGDWQGKVQESQLQGQQNAKKQKDQAELDKYSREEQLSHQQAVKSNSLFSKVKSVAKGVVDSAKTTADKTINTVGAGTVGVVGLATAGVQTAKGNKAAAKQTLIGTDQEIKQQLNKGAGDKGAYLNYKQASSKGDGFKGLKDNVIKPTSQAVTDIAPYVIPVGKAAKGASLLAKVGRGAVDNAVLAGATTTANEAIQGRLTKDKGGEIAKSWLMGGLVGGLVPLAHGGIKEGVARTSTKDAQKALTTAKQNSLLDKVNSKSPPELDVNTEKSLQTVMADIHQPKAALQADATQKAAAEATAKQTEQAAIDAEKATVESKKIDQQLEILTAKAKDAKDGKLSNVDQVKVKQLKEQKAELEKTTAAAVPAKTTVEPSESAVPATAKAAPGAEIPESASSANSTPKISNRQQTELKANGVEPTVVPIPEPKTNVDGEIKTSKLANRAETIGLKKNLTESFQGKPEYAKVNMAKQAEATTSLLKSDPERLIRIAMGHEKPPEGILPESAWVAAINHATKTRDGELLRRLGTESSLVSGATGHGQAIRALGELNPYHPGKSIKDLKAAREAKVTQRTGKDYKKVESTELKQIRDAKATATPKVTRQTFADFVSSIQC